MDNIRRQHEVVNRVLSKDAGDHYGVLGIKKGAGIDEINKAYIDSLGLTYPKKGCHPRSEEAFTRVYRSYTIICQKNSMPTGSLPPPRTAPVPPINDELTHHRTTNPIRLRHRSPTELPANRNGTQNGGSIFNMGLGNHITFDQSTLDVVPHSRKGLLWMLLIHIVVSVICYVIGRVLFGDQWSV
ncbi:hypothetical protein GP486_002818 [Trichoglossum hirsutum]|uniref:J domain-containing protein n=1 Tax=Trichoglossum hirsutum TaxID=265104 RepID=A0A9P8LE17_9PEZI|nr:hypothetical protein GP486_002818 [Trichoglossum hirsutum]